MVLKKSIVILLLGLGACWRVFSIEFAPLQSSNSKGFSSELISKSSNIDEGVDSATLQPYVKHVDLTLEGDGPAITISRSYSSGILDNAYLGNWDLSEMSVMVPITLRRSVLTLEASGIVEKVLKQSDPWINDVLTNFCEELKANNRDIYGVPYLMKDTKSDPLIINGGGEVISKYNKWKFECKEGQGEFGFQLIAKTLDGVQVTFDAKALVSTLNNVGYRQGNGVIMLRHKKWNLKFFPVSIIDSIGRSLTYKYSFTNAPYDENGICANCIYRPERIDASDGRYVIFNWDDERPTTAMPVIGSIDYGWPGNARTVDYKYTVDFFANYLTGVESNQVHWGYGYEFSGQPILDQPEVIEIQPRFQFLQRRSGQMERLLYYRTTSDLSAFWMEPYGNQYESFGPLKKVYNNLGYEVEYNYLKSKCSLAVMHDGLYENANLRGVTMYFVSERIERHGNSENLTSYYFNELDRTRYLDNRNCPIDKTTGAEFLLNEPSFNLGSKIYRTIEQTDGRLKYSYFHNEPNSFNFGKKIAEETFVDGELLQYSVNTWQELDMGFKSIYLGYSDDDIYKNKGFVVLKKSETNHNISEYFYSSDGSDTVSRSMLLDDYGNPSKVRITAKDVGLLTGDGGVAPKIEYDLSYFYPTSYGFISNGVTKTRIDGAIESVFSQFNREYNDNFQLREETSDGVVKTYFYDDDDHLSAIDISAHGTGTYLEDMTESPASGVHRTGYSDYQYGRAKTITHADDTTEESEYSAFGEQVYQKDRFGNETRWVFENGLMKTKQNLSTDYSDISYEYVFDTSYGYQVTETRVNTDGSVIKATQYNGFNKPINIKVEDNDTTWFKNFEYDEKGGVTFESVISPNANELAGVEYRYDLIGRLLERGTRTQLGGYITEESICYDSGCSAIDIDYASYGHFKIVSKRNGETAYDFMAKLDEEYVYEKHINPNGEQPLTLKYNYYANGLPSDITIEDDDLTKVVNMDFYANSTKLYHYDDYETPKLTYGYTVLGEVNSISNTGDGGSYTQEKDFVDGVLNYVEYSDDTRENYQYYANTHRLEYKEVAGYRRTYTYDDEGYVATEILTYPDDSTYTLGYSYNKLGMIDGYDLPNDTQVDVTRDAMQNVTKYVSDVMNISLDYEAQSRIDHVWFNDSESSIEYDYTNEYKYDQLNYTGRAGEINLVDADYNDDKGIISSLTNSQSSQTSDYLYDDNGRLKQQSWQEGSSNGSGAFIENFRYNFLNDLAIAGLSVDVDQYEYETATTNKRLKSFESNTVGYDSNANINSFNGKALTFNSRNLLAHFSGTGTASDYGYFVDGERAREVVYENSVATRDVREIRSQVLGSLVYTDDVIQNVQEELYHFEGKLMARRTVCPDNDGDGINNCHEDALGLDRNVDNHTTDTDGDGINDAAEVVWGLNLHGVDIDTDNDGLPDGMDSAPTVANLDVDSDGISNAAELAAGTDPFVNETDHDNDGLPYYLEVEQYFTNPNLADTDGDDLPDGLEVQNASDPLVNENQSDYDQDGVKNALELSLGLSPFVDYSIDTFKSDFQIYIERVVVPVIITSTLL